MSNIQPISPSGRLPLVSRVLIFNIGVVAFRFDFNLDAVLDIKKIIDEKTCVDKLTLIWHSIAKVIVVTVEMQYQLNLTVSSGEGSLRPQRLIGRGGSLIVYGKNKISNR